MKRIPKMNLAFTAFSFLLCLVYLLIPILNRAWSSGDDDLEDLKQAKKREWVYGKIEYLHDLRKPNEYFMLLNAHPGNPVPLITGGYATTDVYAIVRLRGVSVARELQHSEHRNRPDDWLLYERDKWDKSMRYVWNLTDPKHTFKVYDLKVVDHAGDKVLEGDMEVYLGGGWLDLAVMMLNDGHARPIQADGSDWDWGMETVPLLNPNVPK